jgi:hypothetical protein
VTVQAGLGHENSDFSFVHKFILIAVSPSFQTELLLSPKGWKNNGFHQQTANARGLNFKALGRAQISEKLFEKYFSAHEIHERNEKEDKFKNISSSFSSISYVSRAKS